MVEKSNNEVLVIIPARGGSKGIPKKNLAPIGGIPLIHFSIKAALEAGLPGRICVSTDDEDIRSNSLSVGAEAPFLRPPDLARDDSPTTLAVKHALDWFNEKECFFPKYIMLLQPTCPFRTARNIIEAYELIRKQRGDSLISVNLVSEHPCEYVTAGSELFSYVMQPPEKPGRQNFPEVFFVNGAIYMTRVDFFRETSQLYNEGAILYKMEKSEALDIDAPEDLDYANWHYAKFKQE